MNASVWMLSLLFAAGVGVLWLTRIRYRRLDFEQAAEAASGAQAQDQAQTNAPEARTDSGTTMQVSATPTNGYIPSSAEPPPTKRGTADPLEEFKEPLMFASEGHRGGLPGAVQ